MDDEDEKELYIRYGTNSPVAIIISRGRGINKDKPLKTVSHIIEAFQSRPSSQLANFDSGLITLWLPAGVTRSQSGLASAFLNEDSQDEMDTALVVDCQLSLLTTNSRRYGMSARNTLVVKVNIPMQEQSRSTQSLSDRIVVPQFGGNLELDGIDITKPYLRRQFLVEDIMAAVISTRFVLLSTPAGSGKTTILQLLQHHGLQYKCKYLSPRGNTSDCLELIKQSGIDPLTGACAEENLVVMIDDAQLTYGNKDSWGRLIKVLPIILPQSVKFIISATHSLKGGQESPVELDSLPCRFARSQFLLTDSQSRQFLESSLGLGPYMNGFDTLKNVIILECGGLIGALRQSVNAIVAAFAKLEITPTETEVLCYYLSSTAISNMSRVFGSDHSYRMEDIYKTFLAKCLISDLSPPLNSLNDELFLSLQKSGILVNNGNKLVFTSPIARRYFLQWIYPNRANENPSSLWELLHRCLEDISCSVLRLSVIDGFPKEATFQHLLMNGLAKFTTANVAICPELSMVFPGPGVQAGTIPGEIDFYLNGSLRWGVELLRLGVRIGEHLDRFGPTGKYSKLCVKDYAVVDFRHSDDGEPTNVRRTRNRVTVFYKTGDFSKCKCVVGDEAEVVEIHLQH